MYSTHNGQRMWTWNISHLRRFSFEPKVPFLEIEAGRLVNYFHTSMYIRMYILMHIYTYVLTTMHAERHTYTHIHCVHILCSYTPYNICM